MAGWPDDVEGRASLLEVGGGGAGGSNDATGGVDGREHFSDQAKASSCGGVGQMAAAAVAAAVGPRDTPTAIGERGAIECVVSGCTHIGETADGWFAHLKTGR
jgi:hypothetical protein